MFVAVVRRDWQCERTPADGPSQSDAEVPSFRTNHHWWRSSSSIF